MDWYAIRQTLTPLEREPAADEAAVLLLTSDELAHLQEPSELAEVLVHTPGARDARARRTRLGEPKPMLGIHRAAPLRRAHAGLPRMPRGRKASTRIRIRKVKTTE